MWKARQLQDWIEESDNIVFFGGAGVSTESGVPDFRSTDGLYHQEYDYPSERILSHSFFVEKPEEFYRFYRNKMLLGLPRQSQAREAIKSPNRRRAPPCPKKR